MESTLSTDSEKGSIRPGAQYLGEAACRFGVWAPDRERVDLKLLSPIEKTVPLQKGQDGYFTARVEGVAPGARYRYVLDGEEELNDPASYFQPEGCSGPSEVVDPAFKWRDEFWCGIPLSDFVIYELHIGTLTPEGTFDAAIGRLDDIKKIGVTAIEIMPVAQFPGKRNWGYDGIFPYAVQNTYGGPKALKRLVDACHKIGLAVILDVVYNHIGPEGKQFTAFGPYFTEKYKCSWGPVLNFDGPDSDHVRRFFIENALYWIEEFHIDGLRLDAVSAIFDASAIPFLENLADAIHAFSRRTNRLVYAIAETHANDSRFVRQKELGGMGLDAQWSFDFHHSLHALLTGEDCGYYGDFGKIEHLAKAFDGGFTYTGQYSGYYKRRYGGPSDMIPGRKLVVYAQNHDETGNRPAGDRSSTFLSFEAQKLAAGTVLLSPYIPLIFMGEEYGETTPFLFFVDPEDAAIAKSTREGRIREAAEFGWKSMPVDPLNLEAFERSKLQWEKRGRGRHKRLLQFYSELLGLRKTHPAVAARDKERTTATALDPVLYVERAAAGEVPVFAAFHFGDVPKEFALPVPTGTWRRVLDSSEKRWDGPGALTPEDLGSADGALLNLNAKSFVLYVKKD